MTLRLLGLVTGLILASIGAAQAKCVCDCCPAPSHKVVRAPVRAPVHRAPVHIVHENVDADLYAQSYYDYESSSSVSESFQSRVVVTPRAPWVVAQDDADIRFHYVVPERRYVEEERYYYERPERRHRESHLVMGGTEFTGGVGYGAAGAYATSGAYASAGAYAGARAYAGAGAFVDGYGNAHFDGPRSGVSAGVAGGVAGVGRARFDAWHGYNWTNGIGNGY